MIRGEFRLPAPPSPAAFKTNGVTPTKPLINDEALKDSISAAWFDRGDSNEAAGEDKDAADRSEISVGSPWLADSMATTAAAAITLASYKLR